MTATHKTPIALTIAGSDSSGGAGIQADLKTFAVLGVYGASVVTALTAQNTHGVSAIHAIPAEFVAKQMEAVFSDLDVSAVKIGMLAQRDVIEAVAEGLDRYPGAPIVVDPVMVATSGDVLLEPEAEAALTSRMIPRATLVTPNMPEAARLLGTTEARNEDELCSQAERLMQLGPKAVLLKGGHRHTDEAVDILFDGSDLVTLRASRIDTAHTHGTGCTLSAAIAAGLAQGRPLIESIREAKWFVSAAIRAGMELRVGKGRGPLDHAGAGQLRWGHD